MYISLLNYLKGKNHLDIPLWFNKILESYGVDLIVVPGEFDDLGYATIKSKKYEDVLKLANRDFLKSPATCNYSYVNVIAIDKITEKILGFVELEDCDHCDYIYMSHLASISNSPSLDKNTKIPLIGSILMTAATLMCIGKNLKWSSVFGVNEFYHNLDKYGVENDYSASSYCTHVIKDVNDIIPPKSYYEKYFPELKHTEFYNDMGAIKSLALASKRKKILDSFGGEETAIPKYANVKLISEDSDNQGQNNWLLKNTIVMQKKGDSLVAYWGEKKEFSLSLPIEEKEIADIFILLQKKPENKQEAEKKELLKRVISAYMCNIIGNGYDEKYRNMKAAFDALRTSAANKVKKKLQDSDQKQEITPLKTPVSPPAPGG